MNEAYNNKSWKKKKKKTFLLYIFVPFNYAVFILKTDENYQQIFVLEKHNILFTHCLRVYKKKKQNKTITIPKINHLLRQICVPFKTWLMVL